MPSKYGRRVRLCAWRWLHASGRVEQVAHRMEKSRLVYAQRPFRMLRMFRLRRTSRRRRVEIEQQN